MGKNGKPSPFSPSDVTVLKKLEELYSMKKKAVAFEVLYNEEVYLLQTMSDGLLTFSKRMPDNVCRLVAQKKKEDQFWHITSYGFLVHDVKSKKRWELVRGDDCPKQPACSGISVFAQKGPIALMSVGFLAGELQCGARRRTFMTLTITPFLTEDGINVEAIFNYHVKPRLSSYLNGDGTLKTLKVIATEKDKRETSILKANLGFEVKKWELMSGNFLTD